MAKIRRIHLKSKKYIPLPGSSPGVVQLYKGALQPQFTAYAYSTSEYYTEEFKTIEELDQFFKKHPDLTQWIDIRGIGDLALYDYIEKKFKLHKLVLEDIANIQQRPKIDEYEEYIYAVSRMLYVDSGLEIENEQISFLLFPNRLISFQENYTQKFDPVIHRLISGKGNIRTGGSSYMLYQTQAIKRAMIMIRRTAWPERDKVNDMIRSDSKLINKQTKTFLKDTYDHCMQVIDLVESYKDITTSLIDMNLSFISNRMNEIMKVLTIISSIFIPLTFIAGVYGMNFAYQDPKTGKVLEYNMPELYSENGYLYAMGIMVLIAIVQMIYFWRKGWLSNK